MKISEPIPASGRIRGPASRRGFTLPEVLIALTIFMFLIAGIVFAHLYGLKMFTLNNTKLTVAQWSRETIEKMTDEVHAGNSVQVGNLTNGNFVGFLPGETQQGNCLNIQPTTNLASQIYYFVNASNQTFQKIDPPGNYVVLAYSVTNALPFSAQDFSGRVLTNSQNNQVIHLTLEFYQPKTYMEDADYFKLDTSMKQRVLAQ